jgi:hypothetical protein
MRPFTLGAIAAALVTSFSLAAGAYELPLRGDDLAVGERFFTFVHKSGIQAEGKDIGVKRRRGGGWTSLEEGGDDKKVTGYLAYGKPFYAMAPGKVIACWRNAPDNKPGSLHKDIDKIPGGGNHLWIRQDDGVTVLYAHAKPGSIPSSLCPHDATLMPHPSDLVLSSPSVRKDAFVADGARVKTGDFLGRIGNSGQSASGPHLHVHMEKSDQPVVMKFDHGMTEPYDGGSATFDGPWKYLDGNAMPKKDVLVWPPRPRGTWHFKGTPDHEFQALYQHMVDSREMPDWISCQSGGDYYESKWIPHDGRQWRMHFGMSDDEAKSKHKHYTGLGFTRTSSYTCGSKNVAVWMKK